MLFPDTIRPESTVYYNSAFVLDELRKSENADLSSLYYRVKRQVEMSFGMFVLCIDWLFLMDIIFINHKEEIQLCSSST
jgi:hypothetical protein